MKKLISGLFFATLIMPVFAAPVYRMPVKQADSGWFNGTWYGGIRGELSFLNWENEYSASDVDVDGQADSFSFESVFGGSLSVGHIFSENWRGEVEAGLIGKFEDSAYGVDFSLTVPYVSVNAMYDFTYPQVAGLYVGGGLGIALPKIDFDYYTINIKKRAVSPMFSFMVGWSYEMEEGLNLDLRYRLSALFGPEGKESNIDGAGAWFEINTGLILDNSISLGLRYEF